MDRNVYSTTSQCAVYFLSPVEPSFINTSFSVESEEPIKEVTISNGSTEDREYIAHWRLIEYTITYNLDGGF